MKTEADYYFMSRRSSLATSVSAAYRCRAKWHRADGRAPLAKVVAPSPATRQRDPADSRAWRMASRICRSSPEIRSRQAGDQQRATLLLMPAWINLPNLFTGARLLLSPLVAWGIFQGRPILALFLFATAAFTDYLDGAAARRLRLSTDTGAVLDPIADKCLLSGIFLAMAAAGKMPWWFVAIVFGRDLYILAGTGIMLLTTSVRKFPPSIWGKVSTCVQIGTAMVWMLRDIAHFWWVDALAGAGLWICSGFTLWSGIHYTWRAIEMVRRNVHPAH